ncbi:ribonuclease P protein component [Thiospirillum jenense]|uniref:Ribonuclease P protein component n=1 Tax=Thiospirillum jenense TaxID=1653858 RepID=A0A839HKT8_9GAMM|nr:ribonuclease P protein component [Thiospirillum jenense]MBB1127039.1 ribonuclease P protein component [Thiospirillum jenense]
MNKFPRQLRLTASKHFQWVFATPIKITDHYFAVFVRQRTNDDMDARLGLAVSRKCAKTAVNRNRIKRLIRESFRLKDKRLNWVRIDVDCVVIGRSAAATASNSDLRLSLNNHWLRLQQRLCTTSPVF